LAGFLLARHVRDGQAMPRIEPAALAKLRGHRWPGNVRELDNAMQRALILCDGERLRAEDIHFEAVATGAMAAAEEPTFDAEPEHATSRLNADLKSVEEQMILDALRNGGGSRKNAAEILGISPRTLRYKIAKLREAGIAVP
jgi:two-component system response regulator FlrC